MNDIPYDRYKEKEREAKSLRKDIAAARAIIASAMSAYKKKMLRARSKTQAEDLSVFAPLENYESRTEIQDAYGWDSITEKEMDRLHDLWDAREQYIDKQGRFDDRVTRILQRAMDNCGDEYMETLEDFDDIKKRIDAEIASNKRENFDNEQEQGPAMSM